MTVDHARYELDAAAAVDGDTVRALLWSDRPLGYGLRQRTYTGDESGPRPASVRLPWVDTPELRGKDPAEREAARRAKADASAWLDARAGRLHVLILGSGGFGRLLGDVRDDLGVSLAQHMVALGWPVWIRS